MKPKVGDFIIGESPNGEIVIGPVIALNEQRKVAVVGPFLPNSSGATFDSCEDVVSLFKDRKGQKEGNKPALPPGKPTSPSK